MANENKPITELPPGTSFGATDLLVYVDMSGTPTTKKITEVNAAMSLGISGYSGFSGQSGTGPAGTSGFSGFSGIGTSGFSGFSGLDGIASASGYSGFSGPSGYSGFSGVSGYSGFSGVSGYSGFSGKSGFSGFTGTVGTSGFSGFSGAAGGITGLTATRVPFALNSTTLTDDSQFTYDNTGTHQLTVPTGSTTVPGLETGGAGTNYGFSDWASGGIAVIIGGSFQVAIASGIYTNNANGFYFSSGSTPNATSDAGIARYATNQVSAVKNALNQLGEFVARAFYCEPRTFANLPTGAEGMIARITNCNTTTVGTTAAGGGSSHVFVAFDGSNWIVMTAF